MTLNSITHLKGKISTKTFQTKPHKILPLLTTKNNVQYRRNFNFNFNRTTVVGRVKWHRVFDTCVTEVSTPTFHEQGTVKFICVKTSLYVDI